MADQNLESNVNSGGKAHEVSGGNQDYVRNCARGTLQSILVEILV